MLNHLMRLKADIENWSKDVSKSLKNTSGMILVVVDGAQIICNKTIPSNKINILKVTEPRAKVEGKNLANISDVARDKNIKPWAAKCRCRPSGKDYLPCEYKPQGKWNPPVKTETSSGKSPSQPQQQKPKPPKSKAEKLGLKDGLRHGQEGMNNLNSSPTTMQALQNAAQKTGNNIQDLQAMSIIESTGNAGVGTNKFGYTGLMQMGQDAAKDVGMSYSSMVGSGNVNNNALGGARYMNLNKGRLNSNIPKDPLHLYLAHQQGAGGTNSLMKTLAKNPAAPLTRNQLNNLPPQVRNQLGGNMTQQDFYDYWKGKMDGIQQRVKGVSKKSSPKPTGLAIPQTAQLKCKYGGSIRIVDPNQNSKKATLGNAKSHKS